MRDTADLEVTLLIESLSGATAQVCGAAHRQEHAQQWPTRRVAFQTPTDPDRTCGACGLPIAWYQEYIIGPGGLTYHTEFLVCLHAIQARVQMAFDTTAWLTSTGQTV